MPATGATILHADLDAFYASVEQLLDPDLRGRPIAVGGNVVLAASYEARAYGVHAAMPGWRARQLCPDLHFCGGHWSEYQRLGDAVVDVLGDFTPTVERVSIDEAFLDVAGSTHLFGPAPEIATEIRRRVRTELGLPISVGVARTKHLAKVASQVAKPDGLVVVVPGTERTFLDLLPVGLIWGVGPATEARLASIGVHTIGELADVPGNILERLLGEVAGAKLGALSHDVDPRRVTTTQTASSVGAQSALGRRAASPGLVRATLEFLADRVGGRLRSAKRAARTVEVRVRFGDLRSVTRAVTVSAPVSATLTLTEIACELANGVLAEFPQERHVSLLGLSTSKLVPEHSLQLELPFGGPTAIDDVAGLGNTTLRPGTRRGAARFSADRSVDAIRARFGREAVGYAGVVYSGENRVPDGFRELAEKPLAD